MGHALAAPICNNGEVKLQHLRAATLLLIAVPVFAAAGGVDGSARSTKHRADKKKPLREGGVQIQGESAYQPLSLR